MPTELSLVSGKSPPSASVGGAITSAWTPPRSISVPACTTSVSEPSSRAARKKVLKVSVPLGSPERKTVSTGKASKTSRKPPMWSASGLLTMDDAVEVAHAPVAQEVHYVRPLLGPAGVYEVALAAGLHEHAVALADIYKADREGPRGRRVGPAGRAESPAG